jgi:Tol biopolymer transport system component
MIFDNGSVFAARHIGIIALLSLTLAGALTAAGSIAAPSPAAFPVQAPTKLADVAVNNAALTADGSRVVYTRRATGASDTALYSVPFGGGAATKLSVNPAPVAGDINLQLTPDGSRAIFLVTPLADGAAQLYSAPVAGGAVTRLNGTLPAGKEVIAFSISASGAQVVYQTGVRGGGDASGAELFAVAPAGGVVSRLNTALSGDEGVQEYRLANNSDVAVYVLVSATGQTAKLLSAPLSGAGPVPLASIDTATSALSLYAISPDGSWLAYSVSDNATATAALYRVALSGGSPKELTRPSGATGCYNISITPDSARVVCSANMQSGHGEIYSAPLAAAQPFVKLSGGLDAAAILSTYRVSPDSARLVFRASDASGKNSLYSVPIAGGTAVTIAPTQFSSGGGIGDAFSITPDSARIIYYDTEAYRSVPLSGGASPIILIGNMDSSGGAAYTTNVAFSADGQRIFVRNTLADNSARSPLFVAPVNQPNAAQQISGDVAVVSGRPSSSDYPIGFRVNSAGTRVIFRGAPDAFTGRSLYSVSLEDLRPNKAYLPLAIR